MKLINVTLFLLIFFFKNASAAYEAPSEINLTSPDPNSNAIVDERAKKETLVEANPFAVTFYKQNYILPFYYTGSPYNKIYLGQTPLNESIKKSELKYQLSLKLPVWKNILGSSSSLYFGYTQLAYWQAYNKRPFFRETDFEPEFFVTNRMCIPLMYDWKITAMNIGLIHASNGFGNELERSWNRAYLEIVTSTDNFMFSIKPWVVFYDPAYQHFNPDMANFLGYGVFTAAYKFCGQILTVQAHSLFEAGGRHATFIASYSFPLTTYINIYVQGFSGYGQSLIEYNHRTNSFGIGIAFSNLI